MAHTQIAMRQQQAGIEVFNIYHALSPDGVAGNTVAEQHYWAYRAAILPLQGGQLQLLECVATGEEGNPLLDGSYASDSIDIGGVGSEISTVNNAIRLRKTALNHRSKGSMFVAGIAENFLTPGSNLTASAITQWTAAGALFLDYLDGSVAIPSYTGSADNAAMHLRIKTGPSTNLYRRVTTLIPALQVGSQSRRRP